MYKYAVKIDVNSKTE